MRILFISLLLFLSFKVFSQENHSFLIPAKIKQGSVMLGGVVSASAYKTTKELNLPLGPEEGTDVLFNVRMKNGYFLDHDFALGLDITLEHERLSVNTDRDVAKFRRTVMLAGPFARYFLDNGVFGDLSLGAGLLNFSTGDKTNLFQGTLSIGYAYFINEKISLEPTLSFRYYKEWRNGQANTTLGPVLGFGVQAYILRKRSNTIKQSL